MNATIMVVTKLSKTAINTTYINLEGEDDPYIVGITLGGPPWSPVGKPTIPENVGETAVTVHRHDDEAEGRGSQEEPDEDDSLHTGDDERLDCATSIRAGIEQIIEEADDYEKHEIIELVRELLDDCDQLDTLLVETIKEERGRGVPPPQEKKFASCDCELCREGEQHKW